MVVVPTETHVSLEYGYSKYDLLGWLFTFTGFVGLAGLAVLDHRRRLQSAAAGDGPSSAAAPIEAACAAGGRAGAAGRLTRRHGPAGHMNLLRRFVLVGTIATVVDVVLLLVLREQVGLAVWWADAIAVAAATLVSWVLHGLVTYPDDPSRRWYRRIGAYSGTAAVALLVDVAVISVLDRLLHPGWWGALLVIKVPALAAALVVRMVNYRDAMFEAVREDQSEPAAAGATGHTPPERRGARTARPTGSPTPSVASAARSTRSCRTVGSRSWSSTTACDDGTAGDRDDAGSGPGRPPGPEPGQGRRSTCRGARRLRPGVIASRRGPGATPS